MKFYLQFILISVIIIISLSSCEELKAERVRLMDWSSRYPSRPNTAPNFLFRGNEPLLKTSNGTYFAYDTLRQYLTAAAKQEGVELPQDYYLVDFKLFYFMDTDPTVDIEEDFFYNNPELGRIYLVPIFGDEYPPYVVPESERDTWALTLNKWQHDKLPTLIPYLNTLLQVRAPNGKSMVLYIHCECGCDRTGEVSGAYALRYLNMTYPQVDTWNEAIAGRWIQPNHNWAVEWYCLYLQNALKMSPGPCWTYKDVTSPLPPVKPGQLRAKGKL